MKKQHPIYPSEIKFLETLRSRPELKELLEQLCSISRDDDAACYSADDAESKIEKTGQELKLLVLQDWAASCSSSEDCLQAKLGNAKRSKKNS